MAEPRTLRTGFLGRVAYASAAALQLKLRDALLAGTGDEHLLLLEHPSVFTLGRNAKASDVVADPAWLRERGVAVEETDRGGQVTYHGPGQLRLPDHRPVSGSQRPATLRARPAGGADCRVLADPWGFEAGRRGSKARGNMSLGRRAQSRLARRARQPLAHHPRLRAQRRDRPGVVFRHRGLRPAERSNDLDRGADRPAFRSTRPSPRPGAARVRAAVFERPAWSRSPPMRGGIRPVELGAAPATERGGGGGMRRVGLDAAIFAVTDESRASDVEDPCAIRPGGSDEASPRFPSAARPRGDRTLELGLRAGCASRPGSSSATSSSSTPSVTATRHLARRGGARGSVGRLSRPGARSDDRGAGGGWRDSTTSSRGRTGGAAGQR